MAKSLSTLGVVIDDIFYRVIDYPSKEVEENGPSVLRKGIAYRIKTDMTKGLFPYRGEIGKKEKFPPKDAKVGLYMKETKYGDYGLRIVYPHNKEEAEEYKLGREMDIMDAMFNNAFTPDQFAELDAVITADGDSFVPPISTEDDAMNTIMKLCIRLKEAPFEPYGKRMEFIAATRKNSTEGNNTRNNNRRALLTNHTMSPTKFALYADVWELETAIIVRDAPDAKHKMFDDDTQLIIYPNSEAFEIIPEKLKDVSDMVLDAVNESNRKKEK